jgi:molybdopterin molybdotransferase
MLSVSEASARILEVFKPVDPQTVSLERAAGRVLCSDISAESDIPPFDYSSVDGFAIQLDDARPNQSLRVIGDIRAGSISNDEIIKGECARIMTGGPIPRGTEAVIMVEDTDISDHSPGTQAPPRVVIKKTLRRGENIRRAGEDLHQGEVALRRGTLLRAQELGLLAMLGISSVQVYRQPKMALISTGDELLPVDDKLSPGKIHESNSYALAALAEATGTQLLKLGVAKDDEEDLRSRLDKTVLAQVDVIVSSAGVSVGAFDYVKSVVEKNGELNFWKVNMRPGKPLVFGKYRGIPLIGLPGNPVSAFIGFEIFVKPALRKLSGFPDRSHTRKKAILAESIESDGRESYLRAVVAEEDGRLVARLTGHQGSGNIFSLVLANALLIVPSGVKSLLASSEVEIWPIE